MKPQSIFVVILEGKSILLVENPPENIPNGHHKERGWGLPGGKMKEADQGSQNKAAWREVKEETGLLLDEVRVQYLSHEDKGTHIVWLVAGPVSGGSLRTDFSNGDILNVKWASFRFIDGDISFETEENGQKKEIFVYRAHRKRIMQALALLERKPELRFQHAL